MKFFKNENMGKENKEKKLEVILGKDSFFKGDLESPGGVRIDGKFDGNIKSKGNVEIGQTGNFTGVINATAVVVGGVINGNVFADKRLEVLSTGKIYGDVKTQLFKLDEGAIFEGTSDMGTKKSGPDIKQNKNQESLK